LSELFGGLEKQQLVQVKWESDEVQGALDKDV
jgi:hypothetical protein